MTCIAKVKNGTINLPAGVKLAEGTEVQIILPDPQAASSFAERYLAYIGAADDLPTDLAANLDHYVHGLSKK